MASSPFMCVEMPWFTNNCVFGMPFGQLDIGELTSYCDSSWVDDVPGLASVLSNSEKHWADDHHQERHVSPSVVPNTIPWTDAACLDPSVFAYGDTWPNDRQVDDLRLGSLFAGHTANASQSGMSPSPTMGIEIAPPLFEQDMSFAHGALPIDSSWLPPSPEWSQVSGSPTQTTDSCGYPVHSTMQHGAHDSVGPGGSIPEILLPFPLTTPVITGDRQLKDTSTGPFALPPAAIPISVPTLTHDRLAPDSPPAPRPRAQRWHLSSATTFRCMWRSNGAQCTALIASDRKSISSHLRDVHQFTCDGQLVACEWDQCTACMQRRNIPRHIITRHFEVRVECSRCGLSMSREDAKKKHQGVCKGGQHASGADGSWTR